MGPKEQAYGAVFLVNKPYRWTSFDVVKKIRNALKVKKVGHAGTLDPLATGLLIICAGKETKNIEGYQSQEKEYEGSFVLGQTTESFDLEREVINVADPSFLDESAIQKAAASLTGEIMQIPPSHSAIKKDGKRVYESARRGITVILDPRPVTVKKFEIVRISLPEVHFRIQCSKGTYIRSLARDMGEILGVGAYLSSLKRTAIGEFRLEKAWELDELVEKINKERNENL
ncbi:tRNA pseudouridine(55) synthase TruB [Cyclobacterium jeungdonense]|uniref:tRNA pseudouridine synthase B n=1 Tax=Cyclobacterium jeungdonense TaxID=708087 RepID=A0ABT8C0R9_9BACT|nr:tRNA pseudouridine(55) synthase TruB [Cyclobacterium jeungdonense]MDN3686393.1 tRNA pseudouridine(55) synthase TruB [Cyclobacterium jeungdonense]